MRGTVLLPPLLIFMARMARDPVLMGGRRSGRAAAFAYGTTIAVVVASVGALAVLSFSQRRRRTARARRGAEDRPSG